MGHAVNKNHPKNDGGKTDTKHIAKLVQHVKQIGLLTKY
jgi:hypothetical protein